MSGLTQVSLFLQVAVQMGTPILFGTLGGILCEKSGNINLGVEGMMLMGAVFGFMTALHTGNPFLTIAVAGLAGAFGALIYAVITVTLRGTAPTVNYTPERVLLTGTADPRAARDDLLHTMACKAAIKGGQKNGPQELERVARAVVTGQVKYCPHGRPVAIQLTRGQLEKQFKRS